MFGFLKNWICSDLPKPVSNEELKAGRKRRIRDIVASVSGAAFMTSEDVEKMREKNKKHKF